MPNRAGWWSVLALALWGCAPDDAAPCDESGRDEAECTSDATQASETLTEADALRRRVFRIKLSNGTGGGLVTPAPVEGESWCHRDTCYVRRGASLALAATAARGASFMYWSGCSDATTPFLTLEDVRRDMTCRAQFGVDLTASVSNPDSPRPLFPTIEAPGIRCAVPGMCVVPYGSPATLSIESSGYITTWTCGGMEPQYGPSIVVPSLTVPNVCRVEQQRATRLEWTITPPEGGTVIARPTDPDAQCDASSCQVPLFTSVQLEAIPAPGYGFVRWGYCEASVPLITVNPSTYTVCEAHFEIPQPCSSNDECQSDAFCLTPDGACGTRGLCRPRTPICGHYYSPVCGCDGQTHTHRCSAGQAGVSVAYEGLCAGTQGV